MNNKKELDDQTIEEGIVYAKKKQLFNQLKAFDQRLDSKKGRNAILKWLIGILIILTTGLPYLFTDSSNRGKKKWWPNTQSLFPLYANSRSATDEDQIAQLLTEAKTHYDQQKWKPAIPFFEEILTMDAQSQARFYLGICQLKTGRAQAAIQSFEAFQAVSENYNLQEPTTWYLALAFLQSGQMKEAQTQLAKLSDSPDYAAAAQLILTEIEKKLE
jgi:tetratricopeptide (TPR) repeat protein